MSDGTAPMQKITIGRAIAVGLLWVNGPILPIMLGVPALAALAVSSPMSEAYGIGKLVGVLIVFAGLLLGFCLAWLWWSVTVPKWRLWAYERVDDIETLKERAVSVGLTWPDGSIFERTEIKPQEHAERERQLEREKGNRPSESTGVVIERKTGVVALFFSLAGLAGLVLLAVDIRQGVSLRLFAPAAVAMLCLLASGRRLENLSSLEGVSSGARGYASISALMAMAFCFWAYWLEVQMIEANRAAKAYRLPEALELYSNAIASKRLPPSRLAEAFAGRGEARDDYTTAYGIRDSEMLLALRDYQKAGELLPTMEAFRGEGNALITLGAYAEATAAYRKALAIEWPKPHWSLIGLARVERIQGHYDAAMQHLDDALRIWGVDSPTMPIYYHRGRVLFLQKKFTAAVEAFTRGIPHQPDYPAAYEFRACAYAYLGEFAKAVQDMEQAIKLSHAPPIEPWDKTPAAMAAGTSTKSALAMLCKPTWNDGDDFRAISPLLNDGMN